MNLRNWWHAKTTHRKHNWLLLALVIILIAGGFAEYHTWAALIGVVPGLTMVYLEVSQ